MNKDDQEAIDKKRRLELSKQAEMGAGNGGLMVSGVPVPHFGLPIAT
jgi:hypothetical protein